MRTRIICSLISSVIAIGVLGAQSSSTIKNVPVTQSSPASGSEMYSQYCAVCHGIDGKGGGPAAAALKATPTNLTQLAAKNGGKYPNLAVLETLAGRNVEVHGSQEMPMWGNVLKSLDGTHKGLVQLRLVNLTNHLKSMQAR